MRRSAAVAVRDRLTASAGDPPAALAGRRVRTMVWTVLLTLSLASSGQGAPGDLDPTFGRGAL